MLRAPMYITGHACSVAQAVLQRTQISGLATELPLLADTLKGDSCANAFAAVKAASEKADPWSS